MRRGELGDVTSDVVDSYAYNTKHNIKAEQWPAIAEDAFIWMDYFSIPQPSAIVPGQDPQQTMVDMKKAIDSIPAYVERCSHFFAVCPPVMHQQLGTICDYGTWLGRGWCRLEQVCLRLARFNDVPAIVVKGGGSPPSLVNSSIACCHVGLGNFTCCARGHRITRSDGVEVQIPCDKDALAPLLAAMLKKRTDHLLGEGDLDRFRLWQAATPLLMRGLKYDAAIPDNEDFDGFVNRYRLGMINADVIDQVLMLGIMEGSLMAVEGALERGARVMQAGLQTEIRELGLFGHGKKSRNVAMGVAAACYHEVNGEAILNLLLRHGADPNFFSSGRVGKIAILGWAVASFQPEAVRAIHRLADAALKVNARYAVNNISTLLWASYVSDADCVQSLLDIGANANHINDHGSTAIMDAVRNPLGNERMLKLLFDAGQNEFINLPCRAKKRVWRFAFLISRTLYRIGKAKSRTVLGLACQQGSTALHFAAAEGECESARWLLEHGAHLSLFIKNDLGMTPMDMSRLFGPFPEMESLLGGAELDKDYARKWAIRRGSAMIHSAKMKAGNEDSGGEREDGRQAHGDEEKEESAILVACSSAAPSPASPAATQTTFNSLCEASAAYQEPPPARSTSDDATVSVSHGEENREDSALQSNKTIACEGRLQEEAGTREQRLRDEIRRDREAHRKQLMALMEEMRSQQKQAETREERREERVHLERSEHQKQLTAMMEHMRLQQEQMRLQQEQMANQMRSQQEQQAQQITTLLSMLNSGNSNQISSSGNHHSTLH